MRMPTLGRTLSLFDISAIMRSSLSFSTTRYMRLKEVMDELQVRDISAPVLLRFPDILDNRIEKISNCFHQASEQYGYTAQNFMIYPIKVNQMRQVVEENKQLSAHVLYKRVFHNIC